MRNLKTAILWVGAGALFPACTKAVRSPLPVSVATVVPMGGCARLRAGVGAERLGTTRASSAVALAKTRSHEGPTRVIAYIADADEPTLRTIDVAAQKEIAATPLRGKPEQILILADGRVVVTLRFSNAIEVLEPLPTADHALESRCVIDTDAEPIALAATPDDATLLLTSGWGHSLSAWDTGTLAPKFARDLGRDPRGVVISDDGSRAFVAHVVESRMSVVDLATPEHAVRQIDLRARIISEMNDPGVVRQGCQGFALAKVDVPLGAIHEKMIDRIFAPMVSVNAGDGSESSGYGSESPAEIAEVAVVDASAERALTRAVQLPADGTAPNECLLPRSAAYDDGALYVTCLGIDSLLKLDAHSLDPSRAEQKRWQVAAGPTGLAVDHEHHRAIVWSQFDREVSFVAFDDDGPPGRLAVARASAGLTANVALGRRIFHRVGDPRISADGRACASCHPDGREDALTWTTPDGTRQTPMLAGRVKDTAPYGWMGSSDKIPDHLKKTFERLGGEGLPSDEVLALTEYVTTMVSPIERALPPDNVRQGLVLRGRTLFESSEAGCSNCHDASRAFTDGLRHQVSTQPTTALQGFDTPSLRFVGGTAPYFHDGRYKTLDDVLTAPDHAMGDSTRLTRSDRAALVLYLQTL